MEPYSRRPFIIQGCFMAFFIRGGGQKRAFSFPCFLPSDWSLTFSFFFLNFDGLLAWVVWSGLLLKNQTPLVLVEISSSLQGVAPVG
jgi:hypothetical protein